MVDRFDKIDFGDWENFRKVKKQTITSAEYTMICKLHSKYKKHRYYKPCTCSPKIIVRWINDLNKIYDYGIE